MSAEMNNYTSERARLLGLLEDALSRHVAPAYPETLYEAMAYSLLSPGKRLRPLLAFAACKACGGTEEDALPFACALEMIHAYSLIHDDLPALDNDDLRRGRPTNHVVYGEAMAILAGDALLNLAYEVMADCCCTRNEARFTLAMRYVAQAAGAGGMVGGQTVDILNENKAVDEKTLLYIHANKTGKLIRAALCAGAAAAGAGQELLSQYDALGEMLGLAFQVKDDILNVTSNVKTLGKPVHNDERNRKNTAVSFLGLNNAKKRYKVFCLEAQELAEELPDTEAFLQPLLAETALRRR